MNRIALLLPVAALAAACQGEIFSEPPVHPNWNMDAQGRIDPQEASEFFADGRGNRLPPAGTVRRGGLREDAHFFEGKVGGAFADTLPPQLPLTPQLLARGRARYNIYCTSCHGQTGVGDGMAVQRGMTPPPSYLDDRLLAEPIGYFYHVISNGVRTMYPYGAQIPPADRWAIATYVRALQRTGTLSLSDVPPDALKEGSK